MKKYLRISHPLIVILFLSLPLKDLFGQYYILTTERYKQDIWREYQVVIPERWGNFPTIDDCIAYLDQRFANDPMVREHHWCDCDPPVETNSYDYQQQTQESPVVKPKTESELRELQMLAEEKKKFVEGKQFKDKKEDVVGKLKGNKSLDQLKTTAKISERGEQKINTNIDTGRNDSETAFSDGKIKLKRNEQNNIIPVSPPVPINPQKNLFDYIDRETKNIKSKVLEVKEEKLQILDKKMLISLKIYDLKMNIEDLKLKKIEAKEETKVEEIDALVLAALQMLEESEQLNEKAAEELKEKDKLIQENEVLLNKLDDAYTRSKEHPEESEQLLKNLQESNK